MRFWTIWTMRYMSLPERLRRTRDWMSGEVAAKLPLRIRYWVTMQMIGTATIHNTNILATPLDELLSQIPAPKDLR